MMVIHGGIANAMRASRRQSLVTIIVVLVSASSSMVLRSTKQK